MQQIPLNWYSIEYCNFVQLPTGLPTCCCCCFFLVHAPVQAQTCPETGGLQVFCLVCLAGWVGFGFGYSCRGLDLGLALQTRESHDSLLTLRDRVHWVHRVLSIIIIRQLKYDRIITRHSCVFLWFMAQLLAFGLFIDSARLALWGNCVVVVPVAVVVAAAPPAVDYFFYAYLCIRLKVNCCRQAPLVALENAFAWACLARLTGKTQRRWLVELLSSKNKTTTRQKRKMSRRKKQQEQQR